MWAVLSWMRAVAVDNAPVWDVPTGRSKRKEKKSTPSGTRRKTKGRRSRRRASSVGWYRDSVSDIMREAKRKSPLRFLPERNIISAR